MAHYFLLKGRDGEVPLPMLWQDYWQTGEVTYGGRLTEGSCPVPPPQLLV